ACYCTLLQLGPSIRASQEFMEKTMALWAGRCLVRVWHILRLHGQDATVQGIAEQISLGTQAELLHEMGAVGFYSAAADAQDSRAHMRHVDRHGQHDDVRAGPALAHLPGHLEAAETGHHDIDNEHVRAQTCDQYDSLQSTVCLADHVHVRVPLEYCLETLTD